MNDVTRQESGKQKLARLEKIGEDAILERIAQGELTSDMIRDLNVGWKLWMKWLKAAPGREDRVEAARKEAAHFFAARAVREAQSAEAGTVNVSRLRVDTDKWIASRFNRDVYDQRQSGVQVNLSVNDLYAQAQALINAGDAGAVVDAIYSDDPLHNDWVDVDEEDRDGPDDLVEVMRGSGD